MLRFKIHLCTTAISLVVLTASAFAQTPYIVTSNQDSGTGTLRAALEAGSKEKAKTTIYIQSEGEIKIVSPLVYSSTYPLEIIGNDQTIKSDQNFTLLTLSEGADLKASQVTFAGPSGFDITKRADLKGEAGKGIFIDVRDNQTGSVLVDLNKVTIKDVAYHGLHVSDCTLTDKCGSGGGGAGEGSQASVRLTLHDVKVENVGNGTFDGDGIRVDERGEGDITFHAYHSTFTKVGADGVELDEGQSGDIDATVIKSTFTDNGGYCREDLLKPLLPKKKKGKFEDGEFKVEDVPPAITGSADDRCLEREVKTYKSGFVKKYKFSIDFDDGFDLDEAGDGDLNVLMVDSVVTGNLDEGSDLDEEGKGNLHATYIRTEASRNTDDGFKMSEEDEGSVSGELIDSQAFENGGKGIVYEEADQGDLSVTLQNVKTDKNDDGKETGLELIQADEGTGHVKILSSDIKEGMTFEGVSAK